jgi:hypothetical protein
MDDYVPVNDRITAFMAEYPEGCLQSEIVRLTDSLVVVKAYAYRSPTDMRPAIGHSSLEIPGSTSFTRGSEIENAETSAWGRAIAALGFEVKRGLASREEVRNKQPEPPQAREERKCEKHEGALLQYSARSKKWGHVLEDGSACVEGAE